MYCTNWLRRSSPCPPAKAQGNSNWCGRMLILIATQNSWPLPFRCANLTMYPREWSSRECCINRPKLLHKRDVSWVDVNVPKDGTYIIRDGTLPTGTCFFDVAVVREEWNKPSTASAAQLSTVTFPNLLPSRVGTYFAVWNCSESDRRLML